MPTQPKLHNLDQNIFGLYQGSLVNGKVAVSVASNNLTVAIKTLAGNDPSVADPVYTRIGDTVYKITAALSTTKSAGANWNNAGGVEFATKEVDYFVYLIYETTGAGHAGVKIGFSKIPYAITAGDFIDYNGASNTSIATNANTRQTTDKCDVVGRFGAIMSAGAGYTWSLPASPVVLSRPVFETRWLDWIPDRTQGASDMSAYSSARYKLSDRRLDIRFIATNTNMTGAGTTKITLPYVPASTNRENYLLYATIYNGTTYVTVNNRLDTTNQLEIYKDPFWGTFSGSETGLYFRVVGTIEI